MNNNQLVSIIIPCYNQEYYLAKSLESLYKQSYTNWECIIVDDGSTDSSLSIAKDYSQKDSRIIVLSKSNGGTASARNYGLNNAKGDFIQFLDADDELADDKLSKQLDYMNCHICDVSYTLCSMFKESNGIVQYSNPNKFEYRFLISMKNAMLTSWGVNFSIPMHCWLFKKSFLDDNHIRFDENFRFREDWNFHIKVAMKNARYGSLNNYIGAFYRINENGKTATYKKVSEGNFIFLSKKQKDFHGIDFLLWAYRTSCELLVAVMRAIKHHDGSVLRGARYLFNCGRGVLLFIIAGIMLPVASFAILYKAILYKIGFVELS